MGWGAWKGAGQRNLFWGVGQKQKGKWRMLVVGIRWLGLGRNLKIFSAASVPGRKQRMRAIWAEDRFHSELFLGLSSIFSSFSQLFFFPTLLLSCFCEQGGESMWGILFAQLRSKPIIDGCNKISIFCWILPTFFFFEGTSTQAWV